MAIYDALFERGNRAAFEVVNQHQADLVNDPITAIVAAEEAHLAWVQENPVLAQLTLAPGARLRAIRAGVQAGRGPA
jgi:hypothetical protein